MKITLSITGVVDKIKKSFLDIKMYKYNKKDHFVLFICPLYEARK